MPRNVFTTSSSSKADDDKYANEKKDIADFEKRLAARDKAKTRLVGKSKQDAAAEREAAIKRQLEEEDRDIVPRLRQVSRREYLKKREPQKLQELEDSIRDESFLFEDAPLTKVEKERQQINLELLKLARDRARGMGKIEGYVIPEGDLDDEGKIDKKKREALLDARYMPDEVMADDQKEWEEVQASRLEGSSFEIGCRQQMQMRFE